MHGRAGRDPAANPTLEIAMSNRRVAPAEIQPSSFAFTADNENWATREIDKYPEGRQASAVIPLLSVFWRLYGAARFRVWFV